MSGAPLHLRASMAVRVSRIREALSSRLTRGLEIVIEERARAIADDKALIDVLETLLAEPRDSRAMFDGELIAMLLLENCSQPMP